MKRRLPGTKCIACTKERKHCDMVRPCFACRLAGKKCRFDHQPETRQIPEIIDRLEALAEQIFEGGDAELSSEDEADDTSSGALDPEFGVKRIRLNPLDDPVYTSHPSREAIGVKFAEVVAQYASPELVGELRESTANICLEFTQLSFALHPLEQPLEAKIDVKPYIQQVEHVLSKEYDSLDSFIQNLLPRDEFGNFERFSPQSPDMSHCALYYAVILFIMSRHLYKTSATNPHVQHVLQWASINGAKMCFKLALMPPKIDSLRAIVLLFAAGCEHWISVDTQINLSRVSVGMCRDLGLNRDYVYLRCSKEQRAQWSTVFWISYFINRTLCIRWGLPPAVEASEISTAVAILATSTQMLGIDRAIELFQIYDVMQQGLSSASAEERTSRQLMSESLRSLAKLEKWWQKTYPLVSIGASNSVLDQIDEVYYDDTEVRMNARWTVSTFIYLRLSIYQCCAGSSMALHETLRGMYPADVGYLDEHPPRTAHQGRISSLLTPYRSMQKTALQGVILSTKCILDKTMCVKNLCDGINFLGCMLVSTVFTQQLTSYELECARALLEAVENEFSHSQMYLMQQLVVYIKTSVRVMEQFASSFIKDTRPMPSGPIPYLERFNEYAPPSTAIPDFQGNPMPMRNFVDGNLAEFF